MAPSAASGRVQCEHCPLSFSSGWQLNGHMTHHRYVNKIKKKYEEQKQRERGKMLALLGMIFMSGEAQGSIAMVLLKPNPPFWEVYRTYGVAPKEIDFVGKMSSRQAKTKSRKEKKKGATDAEVDCMDVDLTLKL